MVISPKAPRRDPADRVIPMTGWAGVGPRGQIYVWSLYPTAAEARAEVGRMACHTVPGLKTSDPKKGWAFAHKQGCRVRRVVIAAAL